MKGSVNTQILNKNNKVIKSLKGSNSITYAFRWQLLHSLVTPYYFDSTYLNPTTSNGTHGSNDGYNYGYTNPNNSVDGSSEMDKPSMFPASTSEMAQFDLTSYYYKTWLWKNHPKKIPVPYPNHGNTLANLDNNQNGAFYRQLVPTDLGGSSIEFGSSGAMTTPTRDLANLGLRVLVITSDGEVCVMADTTSTYFGSGSYGNNPNSGADKGMLYDDSGNASDIHITTDHAITNVGVTWTKAILGTLTYYNSSSNNGQGAAGLCDGKIGNGRYNTQLINYGTDSFLLPEGHADETDIKKAFYPWAVYDFDDITVTSNDTLTLKWTIAF